MSHATSAAPPCGTSIATIIGTKKMPLPMTFETMTDAASSGPSRRSSAAPAGGVGAEGGTEPSRATIGSVALLGQELPRDLHLLQLDPLRRALLGEDLGVEVAKQTVLQHVAATLRRIAGIAFLRSNHERRRLRPVGGLDPLDEPAVPVVGLPFGLEDDDERERDVGGRRLLEPEAQARDELVLAVDDAGVVPAGREVADLDRLLEIDRLRAAGGDEGGERDEREAAHDAGILQKNRRTCQFPTPQRPTPRPPNSQ